MSLISVGLNLAPRRKAVRRARFVLLSVLVVLVAVGLSPLSYSSTSSAYTVVHGWPVLPEGFALGQASGVDVDSHNHVFVFHRGARPILCFEGDTGKIVQSFGEGLFEKAHGLEVDHEDNVWVTDTRTHQVIKFSHDGEQLMVLGEKGVRGLAPDKFSAPTDVAVAPSGEFYVSDGYGNSRVAKFAPDGRFIKDWGRKGNGPGEFDLPHGIALDDKGRVYVADRSNSRIQVFDADGTFLHMWQSDEIGRPWAVHIGPNGYLYMVDGGDVIRPSMPPYRQWAAKLDLKSGSVVEKWGAFGSYDGQFYWAHDVAVGEDGAAYVVDVDLGMRVQKFVRQ